MDLNLEEKTARINVGELAGFALAPRFMEGTPTGQWRLTAGMEWHKTLQNKAVAAAPSGHVRTEVPITATWPLENWQVRISGRIDEVDSTAGAVCFREIKTVRMSLPADPEDLRERFPEYFNQLSIYVALSQVLPEWSQQTVRGELVFLDLDDGFTQNIALDPGEAEHRHRLQLAEFGKFLRLRAESHHSHARLVLKAPFAQWRPGQAEAADALRTAPEKGNVVLFEAPTGFGKTGLALAYALEALQTGRVSRVVLLTGKSSGQEPIVSQLSRSVGEASGLRFLQMRNRNELSTPGAGADRNPHSMRERWRETGLRLEDLFEGATVSPESLRRQGERFDLDPHSLARALLALADIWIGDYNYLFSPGSAGVFVDVIGFDPRQTLLIIDEAHNLASRVAGAWSHRFEAAEWHLLASEIAQLDWPAGCVRAVRHFAEYLDALRPCNDLDHTHYLEGKSALRAVAEHVAQTPLRWEEASEFAVDALWKTPAAATALENSLIAMLAWVPAPGIWSLTCLDAAAEIGPRLQQFGQVVAMSATLSPISDLCPRLGLADPHPGNAPGAPVFVEAQAPWRDNAYRVAIDARVDTRFHHRERSMRTTAQTVIEFSAGQPAPIAAFFSSYRYAEDVARLIEWEAPHVRVSVQPRGLSLPEQEMFLEECLLTAHVLFLILGSSFSEGIDQLGGRVTRAMVVGPALPEVNAVQEAIRKSRHDRGEKDAFRSAYQLPGMTRIHQALGRLVRAPGQRADILLHDRRFAEPGYFNLLRPEFQTASILRDQNAWEAWCEG